MVRSTLFACVVVLAASACGGSAGEPGQGSQVGAEVVLGSGSVIESPDHGPMIGWLFNFSNPPQGGVIALSNWDWGNVEGEDSSGGTIWGGPYDLIGIWDGSQFTLTEPAMPVPAGAERFQPGGTNCTDPALSGTVEFLRSLDPDEFGLGSHGSRLVAGECAAFVEAYFDTAELRAALEPITDDVQVDLYFRSVASQSPDDTQPGESQAFESLVDGLTFLAQPAEGIDPTVSISFADGQLTYRSTCNSQFGPFSVNDDILVFQGGGTTAVACDEPDSMSMVGELLSSRPAVQLDPTGALTIVGQDRTLVVVNEAIAEPATPILSEWGVASVLLGQGAESAWMLTSATITIEPDRILIDGPCTDGSATAILDKRRLTVTAVDYTPDSCDEQGTEIEAALHEVFSSPTGDDVAFDIVTSRTGILLQPVTTPQRSDFRPVGLRLVASE